MNLEINGFSCGISVTVFRTVCRGAVWVCASPKNRDTLREKKIRKKALFFLLTHAIPMVDHSWILVEGALEGFENIYIETIRLLKFINDH